MMTYSYATVIPTVIVAVTAIIFVFLAGSSIFRH